MRTYLPTELRNMIYAHLLPNKSNMTGDFLHLPLPLFNPDFYVNRELRNGKLRSTWLNSEVQTTTTSF